MLGKLLIHSKIHLACNTHLGKWGVQIFIPEKMSCIETNYINGIQYNPSWTSIQKSCFLIKTLRQPPTLLCLLLSKLARWLHLGRGKCWHHIQQCEDPFFHKGYIWLARVHCDDMRCNHVIWNMGCAMSELVEHKDPSQKAAARFSHPRKDAGFRELIRSCANSRLSAWSSTPYVYDWQGDWEYPKQ